MIKHRQDYRSLVVSEDFISICQGNLCKALILSVLEKLADTDEENFIPVSIPEFIREMHGLYARNSLTDAMREMLDEGMIERIPHPTSHDYVYDYRINLSIVQKQIDQLPPKAILNNLAGRQQATWDIFGGLCAYCRVNRATTWDHIVPLSKKGRSTKSNLVPACRQCNRLKSNLDVQEWMKMSGINPCDQLMKMINKITPNGNADEVAE